MRRELGLFDSIVLVGSVSIALITIVGLIASALYTPVQPPDRYDYRMTGGRDFSHIQWRLERLEAKLDNLATRTAEAQ